jgi:hypothetical protein
MFYIHVNKNKILSNAKHGTNEPVVRYQKGVWGKSVYCHELELPERSRMVYSADEPILPCGARLVIVSETEPTVIR